MDALRGVDPPRRAAPCLGLGSPYPPAKSISSCLPNPRRWNVDPSLCSAATQGSTPSLPGGDSDGGGVDAHPHSRAGPGWG